MKNTENIGLPNTLSLKGDLARTVTDSPERTGEALGISPVIGDLALKGSLAPKQEETTVAESKLPTIGDSFVNRDSGAVFILVNRVVTERGKELVVLETPDKSARVTLDANNFFSRVGVEGGPWAGVEPEVAVV